MSLRCVLLPLVLVSCAMAAGQQAAQAPQTPPAVKADDSAPSPQVDAKSDAPKSRPHIRFGGLMIGAGYSHFSGGYPYYGYGYGPEYWAYSPYYFNNPVFWSPFYHPGFYGGYGYQPGFGNVKIQAADKSAMVYLNGGLAGRADKLKAMWLEPGTYTLEIRDTSHKLTQKIYVLSGKTLRVTPDMMVSEALQ